MFPKFSPLFAHVIMKNQYYDDLVSLLIQHPDGMRLGSIARTIYNRNADLFDTDSAQRYRLIYDSMRRFLWQQSRQKRSAFERLKWGIYALRKHFVYQLELCFDDWEDEDIILPPSPPVKPKREEAYMLDLFAQA